MSKEIEEIASKHLGRSGDGSVVNPYKTPDAIDETLLVAVPRHYNRTHYGIEEDNLPFLGFDTWHGYEVSFLNANGYPINCVVKLSYAANSKCIVESKSLKLYFNSFNMQRFEMSSVEECIEAARAQIETDLSNLLETEVAVSLHQASHVFAGFPEEAPVAIHYFKNLEGQVGEALADMTFDEYEESPDILVSTTEGADDYYVWTSALRSNCRVTNQPDWGDIFIYIHGKNVPTHDSLLKYIVSMRKENHFHEEICECVYKRLLDKFQPMDLFVACLYTRRGGIDINPVRFNHGALQYLATGLGNTSVMSAKTMRQ